MLPVHLRRALLTKSIGCEEEAITTKWSPFPKCIFSSDVLVTVFVVAA